MLDRFGLNYRLRIDAQGVHADIGRAPPAFVHAVRDIVRLHAIVQGTIECRGRGSRARLRFAQGFPARGQQAVRNVWSPPVAPRRGGRRNAGA